MSENITIIDAAGLVAALSEHAHRGIEWNPEEQRFEVVGYFADRGECAIYYELADSGECAAEEYVSDGDWGERTKTNWVNVSYWRVSFDMDGEERLFDEGTCKTTIEPEEPECDNDEGFEEHFWEEISVRGHGGGVVCREKCRNCGLIMETDTWAQDRYDGRQGLRSVHYYREGPLPGLEDW